MLVVENLDGDEDGVYLKHELMLEMIKQRLSEYTDEETSRRLDSYGQCGPSIDEWIDHLVMERYERMQNLILYGNSWTDAELKMIKGECDESIRDD